MCLKFKHIYSPLSSLVFCTFCCQISLYWSGYHTFALTRDSSVKDIANSSGYIQYRIWVTESLDRWVSELHFLAKIFSFLDRVLHCTWSARPQNGPCPSSSARISSPSPASLRSWRFVTWPSFRCRVRRMSNRWPPVEHRKKIHFLFPRSPTRYFDVCMNDRATDSRAGARGC